MMTGFLVQKHDVHLGNKRFGWTLAKVCPQHHAQIKKKYCHVFKPDPLPSRLFRAQTSHGSKQDAGDVWSRIRSRL